MKPYLIITIDTEEGFDWHKPFQRDGYITETIFDHEHYLGDFYTEIDCKPICLLSYPILNDLKCQKFLQQEHIQNKYKFGTHLHSWVTPPFSETLSHANSFASNLPFKLRAQKIKILTQKFQDVFHYSPLYYKCGRYGITDSTYRILQNLEYLYDFSPFAYRNYSRVGGPDFSHIKNVPYPAQPDFNKKPISVYPATADYVGLLNKNKYARKIYNMPSLTSLKGRAILSFFNLLNFTPLTPEGVSLNEMQELTHTLISQGQEFFHLSYHASSFTPKQTIYCNHVKDAKNNAQRIQDYIHFFKSIGGEVKFHDA